MSVWLQKKTSDGRRANFLIGIPFQAIVLIVAILMTSLIITTKIFPAAIWIAAIALITSGIGCLYLYLVKKENDENRKRNYFGIVVGSVLIILGIITGIVPLIGNH